MSQQFMLRLHRCSKNMKRLVHALTNLSSNESQMQMFKVIERFRKEAAEEIKDERFIVPNDLSQTKLLGYGWFSGFHILEFLLYAAPLSVRSFTLAPPTSKGPSIGVLPLVRSQKLVTL